mgnify:CR=1 FL=1
MSGRPRSFDAEEVLSKAMMAFWRHGYDATGLTQLESATGLGRQSLYAAFGDKRALFLAAVDHYFKTVIEPGFVAVLDAPGSGLANVLKVIDSWEVVSSTPDFSGCLIGNSVAEMGRRDEVMAGVLQRKFDLMEAALIRALKRARQAGEVPSALQPKVAAQSLLALAQGLAVLARLQPDPAVVRNVMGAAKALLV